VNVLLIYPEFPDTFWSFKHALKFVHKKASSPPLGLLTVAAMLPAQWPVRLVDVNVRKLTDKDLAWADCAFVSAMAVQRASAREILARCRDAGVRVVAGGPLFTVEHAQFEAVDHLVLSEAELTLPPFLEDLARGNAERLYTTYGFADIERTPAPVRLTEPFVKAPVVLDRNVAEDTAQVGEYRAGDIRRRRELELQRRPIAPQ